MVGKNIFSGYKEKEKRLNKEIYSANIQSLPIK